jgi:hypothetical protein
MNRANLTWHIENQLTDTENKVAGKIYESEVSLTAGEIKLLATTSKTLVAAPGADRVIEFISAVIKVTAGTAYAEPSAPDDMVIEYSGGQDVTASIDATNFLDQTDDEIRVIPFSVTAMAITTDLEALKNTALQLTNTGGNYTTGTGTMVVRTTYRIHNFS